VKTDLDLVRELAGSARAALEASRQRIDDLNVYPVPDGDTGTNLALTVRSLVESLEGSAAADRAALGREVTRAALMGARGNSGVILSQIVRGGAAVLSEPGPAGSKRLARAIRAASDAAYQAVREPVEGTMLTVVREMAEEAEAGAADNASPAALLAAVVRRGTDALARTPQYLEVLRDAGVVDAGGAGLLELMRGVVAGLSGEPLPEAPGEVHELRVEALHQELSRFRYCTVYVVEGAGLDATTLEQELAELGDSLLVVGDSSALKIHVHTDDPGRALTLATSLGEVEGVEIANMHTQTRQREERLLAEARASESAERVTDVVAVVAGAGNRRLFESLGAARVVSGGQSMNPSTSDLVEAIAESSAAEVLVLPNNRNVVSSAEQAAGLAGRPVLVVPTTSIQSGLAAMVAYDGTRTAAENAAAMEATVAATATGEVTRASRDARLDGVSARRGAFLGLAGGQAVSAGDDFEEVAAVVADRLLAEPRGVLTLLTGSDEPPLEGLLSRLAREHPGVEVEVHAGGQPHYQLLLSAE